MPDRLPDIIVEHSTWTLRERRDLPMREYLSYYYQRNGLGEAPDSYTELGDSLYAYVSSGRWLVECPVCRTAAVADSVDPLFICPGCGDGGWHEVVFPENKRDIEDTLLLRRGFRDFAPSRNWNVSQTVDDLVAENLDHGIGG